MQQNDDLPEDPNEVWGSVFVAVDKSDAQTHMHEDGTEHNTFAVTLRIENHGLPGEKFVEALLTATVQLVASQVADMEVFTDKVPEAIRQQMTMVMAKEWLRHKIDSGDYPDAMLAIAIPTHIDFE